MSGNNCQFVGCNTSRRKEPNLKFHCFPTSVSISKLWVLHSGNPSLLGLNGEMLKWKVICSKHFDDSQYVSGARIRLKRGAVPRNFNSLGIKENNSQPSIPTENSNLLEVESTRFFESNSIPPEPYTVIESPSSLLKHLPSDCSVINENVPSPSTFKIRTPKAKYSANRFGTRDFFPNSISPNARKKLDFNESAVVEILTPQKLSIASDCSSPSKFSSASSDFVNLTYKLPSPGNRKKGISTNLTSRERKLLSLCNRRKQKILQLRAKIKDLKKIVNKKSKKLTAKEMLHTIQFPSILSKALVSMQIAHKYRQKWSQSEKKLAFSIYYKSPSTYNHLKRNGIVLPGASTIRKWIGEVKYFPGFTAAFMKQLKLKVHTMSESEKKCVVLLDEMSIMKLLEYNPHFDIIEGFEDLGKDGRDCKLGTHALVFFIRGLYNNWKIPFAYFISSGGGIKSDCLSPLIVQCLKHLLEVGLCTKAIICDQASTNRTAFKRLKASEVKPYLEVGGHKIHVIYDVPHLIKSLRNNLMSTDFLVDNKVISFKDISDTYQIDSKSNLARAMPKLTWNHIKPNAFSKMSCKLAIQVFSKSVAAAIRACVCTEQLISHTALNTAEFVEFINDLFDSLNSRNLLDPNPNRKPLSSKNHRVLENLSKGLALFQKLQKRNQLNKNTRPPCFDGMVWTITSILNLYLEEQNSIFAFNPNYFLMTNRLNQDPLENFFSVVRQKGGYNRNPSVRLFRNAFGNVSKFSLLKSENSNCEEDEDCFIKMPPIEIINVAPNNEEEQSAVCLFDSDSQSSVSSTSSTSSSVSEVDDLNLENCSITYLAGYVGKRSVDFYKCGECQSLLINQDANADINANDVLIVKKNFGNVNTDGLKKPTSLLVGICKLILNVFKKKFHDYKTKIKVVTSLSRFALREISRTFPQHQLCKKHIAYVVKILLKTRIIKECQWTSAQIRDKTAKANLKLRILKHS